MSPVENSDFIEAVLQDVRPDPQNGTHAAKWRVGSIRNVGQKDTWRSYLALPNTGKAAFYDVAFPEHLKGPSKTKAVFRAD